MNYTQEVAKVKAKHQVEEEVKANEQYLKDMEEFGIEVIK